MRAIVVDDEKLACRQVKKMLQDLGKFQTIKAYTDPEEARDDAAARTTDVAFLDIEMPEINGIDLAEALQAGNEKMRIVFITAYDDFAIRAFELNAIDYLLKPVLKSRLEKTVARLFKNGETASQDMQPEKETYGLECFESLKFYHIPEDGAKRYISIKWRTSKARELYAYLLKEHDRFTSKETLIDTLWPGTDPAKANTQLYTTIYQIRKLMNNLPLHHHIMKSDIGYTLNISDTTIDTEEWEKHLSKLPPLSPSTYGEHSRLFRDYKDHYFAEYGYLWAESERVRLSQLWLEHAYRLIRFLIQEKSYTQALDICQRIAKIEPDEERTMKYEITLFNKMGNVEGAIRAYEHYKESRDAMN